MQKHSQYRYALRKLSVGLTSVAVGLVFTSVVATTGYADTTQQTETQTSQNSEPIAVINQPSNPDSNPASTQQLATPQETKAATQQEETATKKTVTENINDVQDNSKQSQSPAQNAAIEEVPAQPVNSTANKVAIQSQPTETQLDPTLVTSVTNNLSAVGYNVFDIREATEMWANEQLTNWYMRDDFKQVHDQLPTLVPQLLSHADNLATADQRVHDNAAAIMIGMSYLHRWYNISFGDKELLPIMMFDPKALGSNLDSIDWLTSIGKLTYEELLPENNVLTFKQKLAPMLNTKLDLITFLGDLRQKWSPKLTADQWFKSNTGVHIVEVPSKEVPDLNLHLYHRLSTGDASFQKFILPLLNIKNDDMYVVSTLGATIFGMYDPYIDLKYRKEPEVYQEKVKQVHKELDRLSVAWGDHFDFWYRMTNENGKKRLRQANIQVWDSYDAIDSSKKSGRTWLYKYTNYSPAVYEFFGPVGERFEPTGISAAATGNFVYFYAARIIDNYGTAIFTHEMVHHFDGSIYLDGFGRRAGTGVELYADGLLQSAWRPNTVNYLLNTAITFGNEDNRTINKGPERFQTREDLQEYMHGLFDVTYLLDYAEAQAMIDKSTKEKQLMYAQISYDPGKKADVVSGPISEEIAAKLKTIDDFIDNNIIASRGYKAGNYGNNAYQQIPMYVPDYAGTQSATSASGAITFRKTAFELLAAKGWEDGFISYSSNKYASDAKKAGRPLSDTYKLEKIFKGEYNNDYATFKKAMFKERIDKRESFKPITITLNKKNIQLNTWDDLQSLMQNTVDQELAARAKGKSSNLINNLKAVVLATEMKQTNDFRSSIFNVLPAQIDKGEILEDGTSYDLPAYDLETLKKGTAVEDGTSYDLPAYDLETLKKGTAVEDGTSYDLPAYDLETLKKGTAVEDGTSYDLPAYDLETLKKGTAVEDGTSYDLPAYDLETLKKGTAVEDGTSYDLPAYDLETLKKGTTVEDGTSYDLPAYDLEALKKGATVEDGTSYDLPAYDLEALKKGTTVENGTSYDLPAYDLEALKKGATVEDGTSYDLPTYDLEALKKGTAVEDGTSYDLPAYDLESQTENSATEIEVLNIDPLDSNNTPVNINELTNTPKLADAALKLSPQNVRENSQINMGVNDNHKLTQEKNTRLPQTGNNNNIILPMLAVLGSLLAILGVKFSRGTDNEKDSIS